MKNVMFGLCTKSIVWLTLAFLLSACYANSPVRSVVVYTSVDQVYAEPALKAFQAQSGIQVLAVYDVEATKTVGLAQRLLAEKGNPRADVFWSGEFSQTMLLKVQEVLAAYRSPAAGTLPAEYADPQGYWYAFGGRARVILVNTQRVPSDQEPTSIFDVLAERYPASLVGLANPLFGTTSTQAAALYAVQRSESARSFYRQVAARGVKIVDGNSVVRDMVASGQLAWGLTDSDDACGAIQKGAPVRVIFPDQAEGQIGTLVIPNTVALVAHGPHPQEGKALVDYLLSPSVEADLVKSNWIQIPSRPLPAGITPACFAGVRVRNMSAGFEEIYRNLAVALDDMQAIFVR